VALLALATLGLGVAFYAWLSRGTWGAAMRAVRDSDVAAESLGLHPLVTRAVAFAISAAFAGAAGALYAPLSSFVIPSTFSFIQSILFVLVVLIGGVGTVAGPLIGALIVGVLPELLSSMEDMRLLFFGVLLLVVLLAAPGGVVGLVHALHAAVRARLTTARPAGGSTLAAARSAPPVFSARPRSAISANALTMQFGGVRAVDRLSFNTRAAAITSLIGPNGAGKSTALNMLSGFYKPTEGDFALGKQSLIGKSGLQIARMGIARTYQTSQLFGSLTVEDNVVLAMGRGRLGPLLGQACLRANGRRTQARALLHWCGYFGDVTTPAADLAHVDQRLVEIARALAMDSDMILLDEPAAGLSREDKESLAALLRRIADVGIGVLVVEHDMALVMGISDHVVVLESGKHLAEGTPAQVQANPAVQQAYLGESLDGGRPGGEKAPRPLSDQEVLGVGSLVAGYGADPVLHAVNLTVRRGEVVALLGANGAGKSTLMRALSGLHRPIVSGGIHLDGEELTGLGAEDVVRRGMVLVPEGRQVFPELSVLDNIRLGSFLRPKDRALRVEAMLQRFPRLRERLHQRAGLLSGGEQQMLAVARALMSEPRILLLDEPSLGLAPKIIGELFSSLDQLRHEGMTLVVVDQMAALALALADKAYVMSSGKVVAEGSSAEIAADPALAKAYLGA
jgi:ABC-type branched-subunit amino acid transport system ATPase component